MHPQEYGTLGFTAFSDFRLLVGGWEGYPAQRILPTLYTIIDVKPSTVVVVEMAWTSANSTWFHSQFVHSPPKTSGDKVDVEFI